MKTIEKIMLVGVLTLFGDYGTGMSNRDLLYQRMEAQALTELQNSEANRAGRYSDEDFLFPSNLIDPENVARITELQNKEASKFYH